MTVRLATEQDIPGIVDLLKLALGERLMPKSEQFWRWKHIENPFGPSPVLLAIDELKIVGVRAFMRWRWVMGEQTFNAVRAVDTATHPDYQGKGIFRKLTLQLVDQCRLQGDAFVFNTPNKKSKPGYLRMGWQTAARCRIRIRPRMFASKMNDQASDRYDISAMDGLGDFLNRVPRRSTGIQTAYSADYVRWRYVNSPNIRYYALADDRASRAFVAIFRPKHHSFGTELRVCDIFANPTFDKRKLRDQLLEAACLFGARFISFAGLDQLAPFDVPAVSVGPEVTVLPMNVDASLLSLNQWRPTLGDLEVF